MPGARRPEAQPSWATTPSSIGATVEESPTSAVLEALSPLGFRFSGGGSLAVAAFGERWSVQTCRPLSGAQDCQLELVVRPTNSPFSQFELTWRKRGKCHQPAANLASRAQQTSSKTSRRCGFSVRHGAPSQADAHEGSTFPRQPKTKKRPTSPKAPTGPSPPKAT